MKTINSYIVTAYEYRKRRRVTLTQRISYKKAQDCLNRLNFDLKICIEKYKFFTDIRVEPIQTSVK